MWTTKATAGHRPGAATWIAVSCALAVLVLAAGCSNASTPGPAPKGSSAPGVSAHQIQVGALATLSGPVAADFAPIVPGVRAYLDMVNAHGGVDGRKIVLSHALDDGANPTTDEQLARTLVDQDHVFAIVGVATAFFSAAQFLTQTGTPTFGYATQNNWTPAKNLFAAYGSVIEFKTTEPFFPYVARAAHAKVAAVVAYGVPQSADECRSALSAFHRYGVSVGYSDLAVPLGSSFSSDVVHMKQAGVDFVVSCMDVPGNIQLSRAMEQNGMVGVKKLWLDGYDLNTLHKYPSLMKDTYFLVQHVPFQAAKQFPGKFPGIEHYISVMNRYEPAYTYNEVAMEGWLSAALFVAGLRAAGPSPTQQKLVAAINRMRAYTGGGLTTPVNWKVGHTTVTSPSCESFVVTAGNTFRVAFHRGTDIWVCFPAKGKVDLNHPVAPPAGSPGT